MKWTENWNMKYKFTCANGHTTVVECSMSEIRGKEVICEECGTPMYREWSTSFHIPESMSAADTQQAAWLNDRFKNRPSGKRKVLF